MCCIAALLSPASSMTSSTRRKTTGREAGNSSALLPTKASKMPQARHPTARRSPDGGGCVEASKRWMRTRGAMSLRSRCLQAVTPTSRDRLCSHPELGPSVCGIAIVLRAGRGLESNRLYAAPRGGAAVMRAHAQTFKKGLAVEHGKRQEQRENQIDGRSLLAGHVGFQQGRARDSFWASRPDWLNRSAHSHRSLRSPKLRAGRAWRSAWSQSTSVSQPVNLNHTRSAPGRQKRLGLKAHPQSSCALLR